jgi:hypothetical protein
MGIYDIDWDEEFGRHKPATVRSGEWDDESLRPHQVSQAELQAIHKALGKFPGSRTMEIRPNSQTTRTVKPTTAPGVQLRLCFRAREEDKR